MSVGTFNRIAFDVTGEGSNFGTPVGAPSGLDKSYPVRADRPVINVEAVNDQDTLIGVLENGLQSVVSKVTATQTLELDARLDAMAALGKFAFGKLQTTGAGPYTHTLTVGTTATERALPSFTHYFQDAFNAAGSAWEFAGTKIQRMTIRGEAGGKVTMSVDLMIGRPVNATTGAQTEVPVTIPAFNALTADPIIAMARVSSFTIAGGADIKDKLKSFEFVFENVFDDAAEMAAGSVMVPSMERIGFNVSGSFTLKADAAAQATDIINSYMTKLNTATLLGVQDAPALSLVLQGGTSGHQATIRVRRAVLADGSITGQRGKLEKPITFTGLYDSANSEAASMVIINGTVAYT